MLVNSESRFKKDDIVALKNILGEEIICTYVSESDTHYVIQQPFAMAMGPQGQGAGFAPPVMFGESPKSYKGVVDIRKDHCLFAVHAREEIIAAYKSETTGIMVPQKDTKIIT